MGLYFDNLCSAMSMLADHPNSVFMGQAVLYSGTAMYNTLKHLPEQKRFETPVCENSQLGWAIGASLIGDLPICIYPRINFLLEAISQLVSHLDKLPIYSRYNPKVIIRTAIASDKPLNPGVQHLGNYSDAIKEMLITVEVLELEDATQIIPAYGYALNANHATLIIENMAHYDT
jgi:pyruvate/2-oxoglutarate/acetoin dehydrogenase E1 component